ncbi:RNA polymerase sigma-70 factor (ECF subfamily) [Eilatimonas milleporae]|uniref:RNA polymerase sigma-70 factor (ECF subfamily) n=1 Tax=Eilatimonas milleporae TaxID=911205 RepID=A0A3M0CXI3_9PROT|nr:RNA polymerase sigma-70 factor (ECF subfamily) [Eilatimonas milleporae]
MPLPEQPPVSDKTHTVGTPPPSGSAVPRCPVTPRAPAKPSATPSATPSDNPRLSRLFADHGRQLTAFARSKGATPDDAAEIVQDAFLRLKKYGLQKKVENDLAFLRTIIVNLIRDRYRKRQNAPFTGDYEDAVQNAPSVRPDQETALAAKQDLRRTLRDIADLPDITRGVFVRYRLHGHTYDRIARDMGLTIALVRRHLRDAVVSLTRKRGQG